jgi:hypothetical protein
VVRGVDGYGQRAAQLIFAIPVIDALQGGQHACVGVSQPRLEDFPFFGSDGLQVPATLPIYPAKFFAFDVPFKYVNEEAYVFDLPGYAGAFA